MLNSDKQKLFINTILLYIKLIRLHSFSGVGLLLFPTFWSLALNTEHSMLFSKWYVYVVFMINAFLLRSAGCIINDVLDRKFDAHSQRGMYRPIASSLISIKHALIFMVILLIFPILSLLLFNKLTVLLAMLAGVLIMLYPLSKRYFVIPQLVLGITFNLGILLADSALNNTIHLTTWILYSASILFTLIYDTVYAYQDYQDDIKNKLHSFALIIGDNVIKLKLILSSLYIVMFIMFCIIGVLQNYALNYYLIMIILHGVLIRYLLKLNYQIAKECFQFFRLNYIISVLVLVNFIINNLVL